MAPYQPYRRQVGRPQTQALLAMLLGRSPHAANPMDHHRHLQHQATLRQRALLNALLR